MRIYLVRHGEAKSSEEDPDRHLSEKGIRDVQKVAAFLRPLGLHVSAIWHSGKTRAAETAQITGSALLSAQGVVRRDGLAPNDPIGPVKRDLIDAAPALMIVGHLPFLSKLASALVAGDESRHMVAFQEGGVVCLVRSDQGDWGIRWMVVPELL